MSGANETETGRSPALRTNAVRLFPVLAVALLSSALLASAASTAEGPAARASIGAEPPVSASEAHFDTFLDRLMRAESNGHDLAANPRSTALGPFQFIKATFIDVARRHFAAEVATLSDEGVLALRTDRAFARRAAAIYSMENLAYLTGQGVKPTFGDLRLAYLVGPTAAARLLQAQPQTPVAEILGAAVIRANPFMSGMSASGLIARAARDVGEHRITAVAVAPRPRVRTAAPRPDPRIAPRPGVQAPAVAVVCNQKLVSCQRWVAMQANKQRVAKQLAAKQQVRRAANRDGATGKRDNRPGV